MTAGELADIVMHARNALKGWDGKSVHDLILTIRNTLAPLATAGISVDARRKLEEITRHLDSIGSGKLSRQQRDALDTLMLGLWIRVELAARPSM